MRLAHGRRADVCLTSEGPGLEFDRHERRVASRGGGTMAVLRVQGIRKTFTTGDDNRIEAIAGVDFAVDRGEFVSIVGPSGCGKSTLLNVIAGLTHQDAGEVYLFDELVRGTHPLLEMVFQDDSVFPWRTAIRNVEFGLEMRGVRAKERRKRANEMIDIVGLTGFEESHPTELSGGMKQRVAIARALVMEPAVLLMDEPFGALDEQTRFLLGEELLQIQARLHQTVLFVTHSVSEAVQLSDRVIAMTARPGKIKDIVHIDLPRPRDTRTMESDAFGKHVARLWTVIREESVKSFGAERLGQP